MSCNVISCPMLMSATDISSMRYTSLTVSFFTCHQIDVPVIQFAPELAVVEKVIRAILATWTASLQIDY
jgi:hypothetical protein